MNLSPYKRVFALPGVKALLAAGSAARLPYAAMSMTVLFHVQGTLGQSYFRAGAVAAALTVGQAIGSTVSGRVIDRIGLRPVLAVTTVGTAAFWATATVLPYTALLIVAFPAGLLSLPVFGAVRQGLAALVPAEQRRTVYSLDSMGVEIAFIIGPAAAIFIATADSRLALLGVGTLAAVAGGLLFAINPPTRSAAEDAASAAAVRPPRRRWLRGAMVAMLLGSVGATLALAGAEVAMVALLKDVGQDAQAGVVMGLWAAYSLIGGFLYGMLSRGFPPLPLLVVMCSALIPMGLFGQWWLLAVALIPAGMLCAPTISSMVDRVSTIVPAAVRGEAMGMQGSAITIGGALGAPFAGAVIDRYGPEWSFVAVGAAGALLAVVSMLLLRVASSPMDAEPSPLPHAKPGDAVPEAA